ncbi:glycosyltransferase [Gloeobacter morelensis MG652769]|uniref:Glycosyltransferase n=1 Tax=Gloeobacter morelensis MG652769 TaxID=2781736 RepID=A0ABY3PSK6_9CYAN|nr:glycosyltransferase [Gloeobacter morelensis MG652769]
MRITVYSHDSYGLGNVRRMIAICEHLLATTEDLSILLISGSPMLHSFRLPEGLDYIKLPCLNRGQTGRPTAKYLKTGLAETVRLRSELILQAVAHFHPDVLLVDKNPRGLEGELEDTLYYVEQMLPPTRCVLLLRDILDRPEATIALWQKQGFHRTIEKFYTSILVAGMPQVFDLVREYQLPQATAHKVHYCGYIAKPAGVQSIAQIRTGLGIAADRPLVLVTPGGGEDGFQLVERYLVDLEPFADAAFHSLVILGPEMPAERRRDCFAAATRLPHLHMLEFTDDLTGCIAAADAVVSMGGYNTICEILTLGKRAVVVPRVRPVEEQWIRSARLEQMGLLTALHPDRIQAGELYTAVQSALAQPVRPPCARFDLNALGRITHHLLCGGQTLAPPTYVPALPPLEVAS